MCNTLELSGFFSARGDLLSFSVPGGGGGEKKLVGCNLVGGGISTQADTMYFFKLVNYM